MGLHLLTISSPGFGGRLRAFSCRPGQFTLKRGDQEISRWAGQTERLAVGAWCDQVVPKSQPNPVEVLLRLAPEVGWKVLGDVTLYQVICPLRVVGQIGQPVGDTNPERFVEKFFRI